MVIDFLRPKRGANSTKVQRRTAGAAETSALADVAKTVYYARHTPAYRALALHEIRRWSAICGAVLMLGFGAWSAVGVQHAVAGSSPVGSIEWVLGWVLEPVLLAGVALIVLVRSALALAGAKLSPWVWAIELGLLGLSVAANVKALPAVPTGSDYVMRMTGPVGCLLVSLVMVAVERSVQKADIEVSRQNERERRWDTVRTRALDTAADVADKGVGRIADKLSATVADAHPDTPADAPVGSDRTAAGPMPDTTVRTLPSRPVRWADTSTDTPAATNGRAAGHDTGQAADAAAGHVTDTSADAPEAPVRTRYEEAMDKARELGADTVDTLSVRALASRLGCGKTTAAQVRNQILEEQSQDEDALSDSGEAS